MAQHPATDDAADGAQIGATPHTTHIIPKTQNQLKTSIANSGSEGEEKGGQCDWSVLHLSPVRRGRWQAEEGEEEPSNDYRKPETLTWPAPISPNQTLESGPIARNRGE